MFGNKGKIKSLEEEIIVLKSEVLRLNSALDWAQSENINLLQKLEIYESKKPNERGAGRKSAITSEQISTVANLLNQQKKVSEIVLVLNQSTKRQWSHSTVNYLVKKHLVQNMEGKWGVADQ